MTMCTLLNAQYLSGSAKMYNCFIFRKFRLGNICLTQWLFIIIQASFTFIKSLYYLISSFGLTVIMMYMLYAQCSMNILDVSLWIYICNVSNSWYWYPFHFVHFGSCLTSRKGNIVWNDQMEKKPLNTPHSTHTHTRLYHIHCLELGRCIKDAECIN